MLMALFAMVLLTFAVMFYMGNVRMRALRRRELSLDYFRLMQGETPPEQVRKSGRHFSNLFETPVLFYIAGVLYLALNLSAPFAPVLAWLFVASRVLHLFIHLGYNEPRHRMAVYLLSNACILGMWIAVLVEAG